MLRDPRDSLVNFRSVFKADGHRIHGAKLSDELDGSITLLGRLETALTHDLHTDDAGTLGMNLLQMRNYLGHITGLLRIVIDPVHAGTVMVHPR